jgi:hypothetical protein
MRQSGHPYSGNWGTGCRSDSFEDGRHGYDALLQVDILSLDSTLSMLIAMQRSL